MSNQSINQRIQLYCFSPQQRSKNIKTSEVFDKSYFLYKKVWGKTFQELNGESPLYSDEFTRQDTISSIFLNNKAVACVFTKFFDFDNPSTNEDSYFSIWDRSAIKRLTKESPKVLVGSYLTVHPEYRGQLSNGYSFKNLILDASVSCLFFSECSVMTGVMRRNKGMTNAANKCKATLLQTDSKLHGVDVDLVAFFKKKSKLIHPKLSTSLWRERIDFREPNEKITRTNLAA